MASLLKRLTRSGGSLAAHGGFDFDGVRYPLFGSSRLEGSGQVSVGENFEQLVAGIHDSHGVVASCVFTRALLLSELVFKWSDNADGNLFGSAELGVLERPAASTKQQLLIQAEHHVSYSGNAFFHRRSDGVRLLRPDWVQIVMASRLSPEAAGTATDVVVAGYLYWPGGPHSGSAAEVLEPGSVAHWAPEPDPLSPFRGQSWVTSVLREIALERQTGDHMDKFFENAATPNVVYAMKDSVRADQLRELIELFKSEYGGSGNAWESIIIGGGADVKVVGSTPDNLGLKDLRGVAETRIAMRSRVHPVVLGASEGMQGSAFAAGNYSQIRRLLADAWFTPTANGLCSSLETFLVRPKNGSLSFDPDRVMFLQEDRRDAAEIMKANIGAVRQGVDAGFDADAVVAAVAAGRLDLLLGSHSGLTSVQLMPPDSGEE